MRPSHIAVFLTIVLLIYAIVNAYLFRRTSQALAGLVGLRTVILWILFLCILAFPVGRFGEHLFHNGLSRFLIVIGSYWLCVMFYGFLAVLAVDILRMIFRFFSCTPGIIADNPTSAAFFIWSGLVVCVLAITAIGHYNASHPRLKTLDLQIAKNGGPVKELTIAAISDLHIGTVVGPEKLLRTIGLIRSIHPDLILLVGDVFDEDVSEELERKTAEVLAGLQAPLGVYAVTGNHENYAGVDKAVANLNRAGVPCLQDSVVKLGSAVYLVGRKDITAERMHFGRRRLDELVAGLDKSCPIVLMDHQPRFLEEAERNGIDLQLSGHTHNAQLWPLNLFYGTGSFYNRSNAEFLVKAFPMSVRFDSARITLACYFPMPHLPAEVGKSR